MKSIFVLIIFILSTAFYGRAQNIFVRNDTAFVDSTPYCIIRKSDSWTPDYSLLTLNGTEFLFARYKRTEITEGVTYYELTFFPSGQKAEITTEWNFGKKLVREAYRNKMIVNGKFNAAGEERFFKVYGPAKK